MEKISGIIPSSARVASVDMREAAPVRPGTPGFGRPEGVNNLRDRELSRAMAAPIGERSVEIQQAQLDWRGKEERGAAIAKTMSDRFFAGRKSDIDTGAPMGGAVTAGADMGRMAPLAITAAEGRPVNNRDLDARALGAGQRGFAGASVTDMDSEPGKDEFFPKGSFIDFKA